MNKLLFFLNIVIITAIATIIVVNAWNSPIASPPNPGGQAMFVNSSGNVGIGTTNPLALLSLEKNQNNPTVISVDNPNTGASAISGIQFYRSGSLRSAVEYFNQSTDFRIWNYESGSIIFGHPSGGEKVRITGSGNVGIGTTNPQWKLDVVGGSMRADGYVSGGQLCIGGDCRSSWSNESSCSWKNSSVPSSVITCDAGQVAVSGGCSGLGWNDRGLVESRPYPEGCTGNNCTGWYCLQSNTESRMYVRCCPL